MRFLKILSITVFLALSGCAGWQSPQEACYPVQTGLSGFDLSECKR